ncbi:unnamed protein product, partial [Allacma fusca]
MFPPSSFLVQEQGPLVLVCCIACGAGGDPPIISMEFWMSFDNPLQLRRL